LVSYVYFHCSMEIRFTANLHVELLTIKLEHYNTALVFTRETFK